MEVRRTACRLARSRFRRRLLFTTLIFVSVLESSFARAQSAIASGPWNSPGSASQVQAAIDQILKVEQIPGAAVSISEGSAQWTTTAGLADIQSETAATANTNFSYRSITKSFVSTVILQLAGQGRLNLDDPISKYVGGVPGGNQITIRELAEMRSGLFNYSSSNGFREGFTTNPGRDWTPEELIGFGLAGQTQFAPGTSYQYSNTNTLLLGQVIAAVDGKTWDQAVSRNVTGPLGLTAVTYPGAAPLPAPAALGYQNVGEGPESLSAFNSTGLGASGGLAGNIGNLARWGIALGTGATLTEAEYVERMKSFGSTTADPESPEYDSYGFGIGELSGWVGHTGNGLGYEALVMYDPLTDRTIAVLFNASNANPEAPADLFHELLKVLGWNEPNQTQVVAENESITIGSNTVWTGLVSGPFNARAAIYAGDGGTAIANGPVQITPIGLYVPAIYVAPNGRVAINSGGTITASIGGDGADVVGGRGGASLSLSGVTIRLNGDAVTGTGVDASDNGTAVLNNMQITGSALAGLHAGGDAEARIVGTGIDIALSSGHGVVATNSGIIGLSNSNITLQGAGYGIIASGADGPAVIDGSGLAVETHAPSSFGLVAQGNGALVSLANSGIVTLGADAHGVVLNDGATAFLTGSSVQVAGNNAAAVAAVPGGPDSASATAGAGTSVSNLILLDSTLSDASNIAVYAASNLSVSASASQIAGAFYEANDATLNLALKNGSVWLLPSGAIAASSSLTNLSSQNSSIFFTPPPSSVGPYQQVVTRNYAGAGAAIAMNASLGAGIGGADQLVIDGGTATGRTAITVHPMGGAALTTGDGINLVETENGGQTDPGAFTLSSRVASGAYDYSLYQGGTGGAGDWFLRSTLPEKTVLPNLRPEVPLDLAMSAIAGRYGLALLGSYSERADARTAGDLNGSGKNAYWTRAFGETGSWGSSGGTASAQLQRFDKYGPSYDFGLAGVEVGVDLVKSETDRGARDVGGVFVGGGSANASVNGVYGGDAGNATLNAYSLGAYWTRLAPTGWYIDTVVQGTFYGQANTASTANQSLMTTGWGLISSLEVGYPIALGSKWNIEPQAQAIYQHLAFGGSADSFGQVTFGATDTGYGRAGVRLSRAWQLANGHPLSAWIETNLWQAVGDQNRATFSDLQGSDPVSFSSGSGGPSAESGIGIMAQLAQNVSLAGAFQYAKHLDSESGESFGGSANINVSW